MYTTCAVHRCHASTTCAVYRCMSVLSFGVLYAYRRFVHKCAVYTIDVLYNGALWIYIKENCHVL